MNGKLRNMASVYLSKGERMLLLYRQGGRVVNDVWVGSAGGHFEDFELNDAKACVLRELEEELGIGVEKIENLSLRYVTLRRTKGELRQNYYFFAELKDEVDEQLVSNEGESRWFLYSELLALEMPFTSKFVIEHYLQTGHGTDDVYAGVADGEKVVFTQMPEF
ncbi:MAG: NUDIX hydrolase [Lachnospiraceae bacterium]|nr:NUDIX hydrolase [Lachnospiraceae bacterium]